MFPAALVLRWLLPDGGDPPLPGPALGGAGEVVRAALTVQVKAGASCSWNLEMYSRYHPGHWGSWAFFWLNSEGPGLGGGEPGTFLRRESSSQLPARPCCCCRGRGPVPLPERRL